MLKGRQRRWTRKNRRLFVVGPCRLSAPPRPGAGATGVTGGVSGSAERKRAADPPPPPGLRGLRAGPLGSRRAGATAAQRHGLGSGSSSSRPAQGGGFVAFPVGVVRGRVRRAPFFCARRVLRARCPGARRCPSARGRRPGPSAAWVPSVSMGLGFRPLRRALRALADARKRGVPLSVLCPCGHRLVLRLWGNLVPRSLCSSPRGAWLLRRRIAVGCVGCGFCGRAVCLHGGKPPARFSFHRVASRWVACLVPDARPDRCGGGAG